MRPFFKERGITMLPTAKKLPSGKWRARAYDYTDTEGKRHYVSFTANSKSEAQAAARAHKPSITTPNTPYPEITLKTAYTRFIDSHKNEWSPSTLREYTRQAERDFPVLMQMQLKDITPEIVQAAVNEEAAKCAVKTLRNKHGLLHKVLKTYAPNIILHTDFPKRQKIRVTIPTSEEVARAVEVANDYMRVPILLASKGSLRRSEICALTPEDFTDTGVMVTKAMVKDINNEWVIKPPKTEAGYRFCPLPLSVIKEARQWKHYDITPDVIRYRWANMKEKYGFDFRFHAFRHYWASLLHSKGMPDQYICKIGGWETPEMLHKIYAHALTDKLPEFSSKVVNIFDQEFSKKQEKKA